jgi:hypothetical protein
MMALWIPILGIVCSLVIAPAMIFGFILLMRKSKVDVEKVRLQKEIKELELHKEEIHLKVLLEENRKYDQIINR